MDSKTNQVRFAPFVPDAIRVYVVKRLDHLKEYEEGPDFQSGDFRGCYQIAMWPRLVSDDRMREVFSLLLQASDDPKQWAHFLEASLRARDDFRSERENLKEAIKLKPALVKSLRVLQMNLTKLNEIADARLGPYHNYNVNWPSEIFEVPLVRRPKQLCPFDPIELIFDGHDRLEIEQRVGLRRYSFHLLEVIEALTQSVESWKPAPGFGSDSAQIVLKSQNASSTKTQFIRSFWYNLVDSPNFRHLYDLHIRDESDDTDPLDISGISPVRPWKRSPELLKAIACTSEVIRDNPSEAIDAADMRDALAFLDTADER